MPRSKLSDLTAAARSDVIPGYVLSPPRLPDYGLAEDAFARWHVARIGRGAARLPSEARDAVLARAEQRVADGWFSFAMPGWDAQAKSGKGGTLLLWLCLRVKHPQVTLAQARELYAADSVKVSEALYELLGYAPARRERGGGSKKAKARRRNGDRSGGPSPTTSAPAPSPAVAAA